MEAKQRFAHIPHYRLPVFLYPSMQYQGRLTYQALPFPYIFTDTIFVYRDTLENVHTSPSRPCPKCAKAFIDGEDPCLGHIEGVVSACCGHMNPRNWAQVKFEDGQCLYGQDALDFFASLTSHNHTNKNEV